MVNGVTKHDYLIKMLCEFDDAGAWDILIVTFDVYREIKKHINRFYFSFIIYLVKIYPIKR